MSSDTTTPPMINNKTTIDTTRSPSPTKSAYAQRSSETIQNADNNWITSSSPSRTPSITSASIVTRVGLNDRIKNSPWSERSERISSTTTLSPNSPNSIPPALSRSSSANRHTPHQSLSLSSSLFATRSGGTGINIDSTSRSASPTKDSNRSPLSTTDLNGDNTRVGLMRNGSTQHKRSMTLPQLSNIPSPSSLSQHTTSEISGEEVTGMSYSSLDWAGQLITRRRNFCRITWKSEITVFSSDILFAHPFGF